MKRKPKSKKLVALLEVEGGSVRVWYDIKEKQILFRKKYSPKVNTISLRALYDQVTGQIVMPFAQ